MSTTVRTTRRTVLGMGLAAIPLLTACSQDASTSTSLTDPVRRESLGDELALVALYQAAIDQEPDLAPLLAPILAAHEAHADALREGLPDPQSPVPTPIPTLKADVLAQLRDAERIAVGVRSGACTRTADGELASLLCLISASEAQHVTQLAAAP